MPPITVGLFSYLSLVRHGKKDAKKYASLKDYSRTHILIAEQSKSQRGQISVNSWLNRMATAYATGNTRIQVQARGLVQQIALLEKVVPESGREAKAKQVKLGELTEELYDLESQYKANQVQIKAFVKSAETSMPAWARWYEQKAAIYTAARARKSKVDLDSVKAEIPKYESVPLAEVTDWQDQFLKPQEIKNV